MIEAVFDKDAARWLVRTDRGDALLAQFCIMATGCLSVPQDPPPVPGIESFAGKWYHTESAINEPRYRDHIPVMLGGSGEKKTFRLAARYADHLNLITPMSELRHKLDLLKQRCAEAERDPSTLETSTLLTVVLDGHDTRRDVAEAIGGRAVRGTAEQVAEQIKTNVLDVGVDGVIVNLPTHGYTPGVITEVGEALKPLVSA